jgi:hypothetical protein
MLRGVKRRPWLSIGGRRPANGWFSSRWRPRWDVPPSIDSFVFIKGKLGGQDFAKSIRIPDEADAAPSFSSPGSTHAAHRIAPSTRAPESDGDMHYPDERSENGNPNITVGVA